MFNKYYLCLTFNLILTFSYSYAQECTKINVNNRIDCAPDHPDDKVLCAKRGCCYELAKIDAHNPNGKFNEIKIYITFLKLIHKKIYERTK